jgi:ABC-type nitrate/sulfonate/bicarbonate transport system ATPase subunit
VTGVQTCALPIYRIIVMSGAPGRIVESLSVPMQRPRGEGPALRPELAQLQARIWRMLEAEVRDRASR